MFKRTFGYEQMQNGGSARLRGVAFSHFSIISEKTDNSRHLIIYYTC
jgi:hypothetical protein